MLWNPYSANMFATVGKDHLYICQLADSKIKKGKAASENVSFSSVAWSLDPANKEMLFTGGSDGQIYSWNLKKVYKSIKLCHNAVQSLCCVMKGQEEFLFAAGSDNLITQFKVEGKSLTNIKTYKTEAPARSLDVLDDSLLVGLQNGDIVVFGGDRQKVIMQSHCEGETWGLEVIHLSKGEIRVLTSADDNRILAYNLS